MAEDIRLKTAIFSNPKILSLIIELDDHACVCLLRLWCFTANHKPDGDLSAYSPLMIETAAGWKGDKGIFFESLCNLGFLDCDGESILLHDWSEHQKWVVGSSSRSETASKKVLLRWCLQNLNKKQYDNFREWFDSIYQYNKDDNTDIILALYKQYTNSNTSGINNGNTPLLSSPLPSPLPIPKDNNSRFTPPSLEEVADYCKSRKNSIDPELWIDSYKSKGWMVGKNKMKDWKAAVRTWERNNINKKTDTKEYDFMRGAK